MGSEWSTPEQKLSHKNKTLRQHIEEVKSLLNNFLEFYGFQYKYYKIADYLAEYHDYGKLHEDWELGSKKGHSHLSIKWLFENRKKLEENEKLTYVLWYLILKHHSSLSESVKSKIIEIDDKEIPLQSIVDSLCRPVIEKLSFEEKINLVDVFGLFKIADICSAENKLEVCKFEKPKFCQEDVKKIFGKLDNKRWKEQLKLINLPEIGMLRAYTGWGKTDAVLLSFLNKDVSKIFYLFPTITAINKFYLKLSSVFGNKVSKYFYFYDTEINEDLEKIQNLFFIENFINSYVITTVDQFLLTFLQVGKYYRKRIMFKNAGIVIDEVHLLNPLMLNLLLKFLNKYRDFYNFKVIFMSATLPDSLKEFLKDELSVPSKKLFLDFSEGYKRKRRIMWRYIDNDIEQYIEKIVDTFKKSKRVLVIVNTVEKAITLGEKLEKELQLKPEKDFIVFHARFMYEHRKEKEEDIEKLNKKPHILIATQVCEVSLDISYDFLFTELAPISALIQRFGRINRYGKITKEINVLIFKPEIKKRYPYSKNEIVQARKIIENLQEENLKNELMILDEFNSTLSYKDFEKEVENISKKVDYWENSFRYFYSFNVQNEELLQILSYRDSFTTLVIPAPKCILDEKTRNYVKDLLSRKFEGLNFDQKRQLLARYKKVSVPVPIWWLKGMEIDKRAFPIINFENKIYDKKLGFRDIKGEII